MAVIDVSPLVMKNVVAIIGDTENDYRKHLDGVTFTPASSVNTWTGLGLNTHTDAATATWTVDLSFVQDWETTDSLCQFLFENEGETVPMEFQPKDGSGPSFTANVVIVPGAIGGTVNTFAVTTVSLGSDKPVLVPAV